MYHEIVNDKLAGIPVAVTYCPLCNTGTAFRRTANGKILDFGTTGRLRYSNLLMYDRQTESWWQQATGTAVIGTYTGQELEMFPSFPKRKSCPKIPVSDVPPCAPLTGDTIPVHPGPIRDRRFRRTIIPSTEFWRFPKGRRQTLTVTGRCGSSGRPIAVFWFPAYAFSDGDFPGENFSGGE